MAKSQNWPEYTLAAFYSHGLVVVRSADCAVDGARRVDMQPWQQAIVPSFQLQDIIVLR